MTGFCIPWPFSRPRSPPPPSPTPNDGGNKTPPGGDITKPYLPNPPPTANYKPVPINDYDMHTNITNTNNLAPPKQTKTALSSPFMSSVTPSPRESMDGAVGKMDGIQVKTEEKMQKDRALVEGVGRKLQIVEREVGASEEPTESEAERKRKEEEGKERERKENEEREKREKAEKEKEARERQEKERLKKEAEEELIEKEREEMQKAEDAKLNSNIENQASTDIPDAGADSKETATPNLPTPDDNKDENADTSEVNTEEDKKAGPSSSIGAPASTAGMSKGQKKRARAKAKKEAKK
ncbi:hypothetical protein EX30DRAFT_339249 [Ascodesmis nigricans]|uniref:Uncharacterized protein n=1 Tax=Ascodesmis nigricans TaxID=341454 RepID=A0A4S2N1J6_9PEZI|nr:hypothetical protein EX30DRAFT_339249 [Ascodesmis nigricans]